MHPEEERCGDTASARRTRPHRRHLAAAELERRSVRRGAAGRLGRLVNHAPQESDTCAARQHRHCGRSATPKTATASPVSGKPARRAAPEYEIAESPSPRAADAESGARRGPSTRTWSFRGCDQFLSDCVLRWARSRIRDAWDDRCLLDIRTAPASECSSSATTTWTARRYARRVHDVALAGGVRYNRPAARFRATARCTSCQSAR